MNEAVALGILIVTMLVLLAIVIIMRVNWQLRDELDQHMKNHTTFRVVKRIRGTTQFNEEVILDENRFFHITDISPSGRKYDCLNLPDTFFQVPAFKMVEYLQDGRIVPVKRKADG